MLRLTCDQALELVRPMLMEGPLPEQPNQRTLDEYRCMKLSYETSDGLLTNRQKAVYLASCDHFGSAWLRALPSRQAGTLLDADHFRMACGIRMGAPICHAFKCRLCDVMVDPDGLHPLSCRASAGRTSRHAELNDIVQRSLRRAKIASCLEPNVQCTVVGLRPDGITIPPWANGKSLVWDVTVSCTAADSYIDHTSHSVGWAAEHAAREKRRKYVSLLITYLFVPLAMETLGPLCREGSCFLKDLSRRLENVTGDRQEGEYLRQRLSIAVWRGNCVSIKAAMG